MSDIIVDGVPKISTELAGQTFEGCVREGHHRQALNRIDDRRASQGKRIAELNRP